MSVGGSAAVPATVSGLEECQTPGFSVGGQEALVGQRALAPGPVVLRLLECDFNAPIVNPPRRDAHFGVAAA